MDIALGIGAFFLGVAVIIGSAEKLVESLVGASMAFAVSTLLLAFLLVGFDAENLAVGVDGAARRVPGVAVGSVIGANMVAVALAIGLTAIVKPVKFAFPDKKVLLVAPVSALAAWLLSLDGNLGATDGIILLIVFLVMVVYLIRSSRQGLEFKGEAQHAAEEVKRERRGKMFYAVMLIATLVGLGVGAELVVWGTRRILNEFAISGTLFGLTALAFALGVEELARSLVPTLKGHPEVAIGNAIGSAVYFYTFNAGLIALTATVAMDSNVLWIYFPFGLAATGLLAASAATGQVSRLAGLALTALYAGFVVAVYLREAVFPG